MRIAELRQREDFGPILDETLERALSDLNGAPVRVRRNQTRGAQRWLVQPWLSVYYTAEIGRPARQYFRDAFRFTPYPLRLPAQFLLGTLLATGPAMRHFASTGFHVTPALPRGSDWAIMPGNRRVRLFDFGTGVCRVVLKQGFDVKAQLAEIGLRTPERSGPFVPILRSAESAIWYEEPLIDGFSLSRCPPWRSRRALEVEAIEALGGWLRSTAEPADPDGYFASLLATISAGLARLGDRFGSVPTAVSTLVGRLGDAWAGFSGLELAHTHGDFQPGNVLIEAASGRVYLIDWEYASRRSRWYDAFVWGLRARFPVGLAGRARRFLASGALGEAGRLVPARADPTFRHSSLVLFLLEDFCWRIDQCLGPERTGPDASLLLYSQEVSRLQPFEGKARQ